LKEMERDGLVNRKVYQVIPPMVEYSLSKEGKRLMPVLESMQKWGLSYKVKGAVEVEAN
jgi:DNA-binding HxlR family transcriptional regulator